MGYETDSATADLLARFAAELQDMANQLGDTAELGGLQLDLRQAAAKAKGLAIGVRSRWATDEPVAGT